jgi:hypothetical protein
MFYSYHKSVNIQILIGVNSIIIFGSNKSPNPKDFSTYLVFNWMPYLYLVGIMNSITYSFYVQLECAHTM